MLQVSMLTFISVTNLKEAAYGQCRRIMTEKADQLKARLLDLKDSISNDTKSTAGDKHETARAHLQIEQEQVSKQLAEALAQLSVLDTIDTKIATAAITKGSLIRTNNGYFFMSIPVGKMLVNDETIIALSPQSPLGMRFIGLKAGDATEMNGRNYMIDAIV